MVLGYLDFQPQTVILSYVELKSVTKLRILLVSYLKYLLKLLPKELFVVYENVLRRFLHEVEDAHYEHQAYRNGEEYLDDQLWDQVVGDLTQKEDDHGDDAKEPNYVGKLHEKSILQKVILFSVDGVDFEGYLFALNQNLLVLLLGHALLKVILV